MQTERVTFLTTPDHKAALDAFAATNGRSVGHVVREATNLYLSRPAPDHDAEDEALELLLPMVEAAVADMRANIAAMRTDIERTCDIVDAILAGEKR